MTIRGLSCTLSLSMPAPDVTGKGGRGKNTARGRGQGAWDRGFAVQGKGRCEVSQGQCDGYWGTKITRGGLQDLYTQRRVLHASGAVLCRGREVAWGGESSGMIAVFRSLMKRAEGRGAESDYHWGSLRARLEVMGCD